MSGMPANQITKHGKNLLNLSRLTNSWGKKKKYERKRAALCVTLAAWECWDVFTFILLRVTDKNCTL